MDTLTALNTRVSVARLTEPGPSRIAPATTRAIAATPGVAFQPGDVGQLSQEAIHCRRLILSLFCTSVHVTFGTCDCTCAHTHERGPHARRIKPKELED